MALNSLPGRPLRRNEIDALGNSETIGGIYPTYGEQPENRDTAYGVVLKLRTTAYALVYEESGWTKIDERECRDEHGGFHVDEMDLLEELMDAVSDRLSDEQPTNSV